MTLFKVLSKDGRGVYSDAFWSLPHDGQPGQWMPRIGGVLAECEVGYHLAEDAQVLHWLGPRLFEAQARGRITRYDDKINCREARLLREFTAWNGRTARLFACDCAERALQRISNSDARSVEAIQIARAFANGEATSAELDAAWVAAGVATWAAAGDARDAAEAAAGATAGDAAWAAEIAWQLARLREVIGL